MNSRLDVHGWTAQRVSSAGSLALAAVCMGWFAPAAVAKEPSLMAIELYDGPNGAAYVQLADVLINGKAEMRDCTAFQSAAIDKSTYGKMEKLSLGAGGILERGADGVLRYSVNHGPATCVAPFNVKYEHSAAYSLSELADQAVLRATPIGPAGATPTLAPPLKKGVKLVFLEAPNLELAEFLRAQRASDIPGWQSYLGKYPGSAHTAEAKVSLAALFVNAGEAALAAYDKTAADPSPSYSGLKTAKAQSEQAHAQAPDLAALGKLDGKIASRLGAITEKGRAELNAYRDALNSHAAGLVHLKDARKFSDIVSGIDPYFPAGQAFLSDLMQDSNALEAALQSAEAAVNAKQFDQAVTLVVPYRAFRDEEPRVAAAIDAGYGYHFGKARQAEQTPDWQGAIKEYEKAAGMKDTAEARDALKNAREQLVVTQNKAAAAKAQETSRGYEQQRDIIGAYETLANLPAVQQAQVTDDLERLKPAYIQAASQKAKELRQAHDPIKGLRDEIEIENAYVYLQHAFELSGNDSFRDRMDLLGNELSKYLLERAQFYLAKPNGSGTELGWKYLEEAVLYKADNMDAVRDTQNAAQAAHAMRSKLSIRVQFRDQTSQRDSAGFAGQLENAIITGLEGSTVPVKVVRAGEQTAVEPDFQLAGDVIQHHLSVAPAVEPMQSTYLWGTKEVESEAWSKANRAYEKAVMDLQTAQTALQGGEARGKKHEIEDLSKQVAQATKNVEDAHVQLDATPKTNTVDIKRPYTYAKRTVNLSGVIQLQFRVSDSFSGQTADLAPITKEDRKQFVILEDVKPEDTEGVKKSGTMPNTDEFLTNLENSALDALIGAARKRVEDLPRKVYDGALSRENEGDLDSAGESYLRFLNVTREDGTPERQHARHFLLEQFNMRPGANTPK